MRKQAIDLVLYNSSNKQRYLIIISYYILFFSAIASRVGAVLHGARMAVIDSRAESDRFFWFSRRLSHSTQKMGG